MPKRVDTKLTRTGLDGCASGADDKMDDDVDDTDESTRTSSSACF